MTLDEQKVGFYGTATVWKKKIFRHLEDYNSANMTDIHKIPFDQLSLA